MSVGHWGCKGILDLARSIGTHRPARVEAALGGIGLLGCRGHWAIRGCRGCIGCCRWTGSQTILGPSAGSQHSHWFPLGNDLPQQGQARAPVEGPITPAGFPWEVTYPTKAKQVTEMSSAGYYIHLELYLVTV